jgi:hypothetical protein
MRWTVLDTSDQKSLYHSARSARFEGPNSQLRSNREYVGGVSFRAAGDSLRAEDSDEERGGESGNDRDGFHRLKSSQNSSANVNIIQSFVELQRSNQAAKEIADFAQGLSSSSISPGRHS